MGKTNNSDPALKMNFQALVRARAREGVFGHYKKGVLIGFCCFLRTALKASMRTVWHIWSSEIHLLYLASDGSIWPEFTSLGSTGKIPKWQRKYRS